ncbi:hypothetical protein [Algicella marina]|uniref:Uncharacterized protein n=1 Tax=Algicella marina TaxID=2683284 RepID=A0A6P1T958_9RHOB|nr:hypothetical protein [Algicella marina]QHQ37162.1 hypothetical protein GO499_19225 [Algicella marina]
MTEIAEIQPRVRTGTFIYALIGGPFWGATLTALYFALPLVIVSFIFNAGAITILAIPYLGVLFGFPFYLTIGTVAFWLAIRAGAFHPGHFALAAFVGNLLTPLACILFGAATGLSDMEEVLIFFTAFGLACAPIYGWGFGDIYLFNTARSVT